MKKKNSKIKSKFFLYIKYIIIHLTPTPTPYFRIEDLEVEEVEDLDANAENKLERKKRSTTKILRPYRRDST